MRGRKPIPNAIKRAAGDGKRDSGKRKIHAEPKSEGAPSKPATLSGDAAAAWDMFAAELAALGTLARADAAALQMLCEAWAQREEAAKALQESGTVVKWPNGQPGASPYFKTYHEAAKLVRSLLAEFGLTPSSRSRLKAPAAEEPEEFDLVKALERNLN